MGDSMRPGWWSYPVACREGHEWRPGAIIAGWTRARALTATAIRSCGAARQAAARRGITRRTRPVPSCWDRTARQR